MRRKILLITGLFISMQIAAQTGIGTSTPINKFQVEAAAAAPLTSGTGFNGNLRLGATGANQVLDFGLGTTYGWLQSRDKTAYGTNYILALNPNGGNVGIGTAAPSVSFDVNGTVRVRTLGTYASGDNLILADASGNFHSRNITPVNVQASATTYTLQLTDNGGILTFASSSAVTITVPYNTLPAGFVCQIIQKGTGQITVVGATSFSLYSSNGFKSRAQYSAIGVVLESAILGYVTGDTAL